MILQEIEDITLKNERDITTLNSTIIPEIQLDLQKNTDKLKLMYTIIRTDGIDDSKAISNAIASNKRILLPDPNYKMLSTVTIPGNRTIEGCNFAGTIIECPETISPFIVDLGKSNVIFKNLYIKGKPQGYPTKDAKEGTTKATATVAIKGCDGANNINIEGCEFDGFTMGIFMNSNNAHVNVNRCKFRNMTFIPTDLSNPSVQGSGGYGIVFQQILPLTDGTKHYSVTNCTFEDTVYRHGIYTQSSEYCCINNNTFFGKETASEEDFITAYEARIVSRGSSNMHINNNIFIGGLNCISLIEGNNNFLRGHDIDVSQNTVRNLNTRSLLTQCFSVSNSDNVNIHDNILSNCNNGLVNIPANCDNVNIYNNYCECTKEMNVINIGKDGLTSISIYNNKLKTFANGRCISMEVTTSATQIDGLRIYNNTMIGGFYQVWLSQATINNLKIKDNKSIAPLNCFLYGANPMLIKEEISGNDGYVNLDGRLGRVKCFNNNQMTFDINGCYPYSLNNIPVNTITTIGSTAPTKGTWILGDRTIKNIPQVGQPKSWICTLGGTPGTWTSEGVL